MMVTSSIAQSTTNSQESENKAVRSQTSASTANILKVATLNLAHGRGDGLNQLLLSEKTIRTNLTAVATTLGAVDADIVGLQEADGSSWWSGSFDHVAYLANYAKYPSHKHAGHSNGWFFTFGTAVLSKWPIVESINHTFTPSPPTLSKGFSLVQIAWKPDPNIHKIVYIDMVSVHLDFSRQTVRERQVDEMDKVLEERHHPLVVMGDFNSDWQEDQSVIKDLAKRLDLKTYRPESTSLGTYVKNGRRLDWVLASKEFGFESYKVLPDILSDHYAVIAELTLLKN